MKGKQGCHLTTNSTFVKCVYKLKSNTIALLKPGKENFTDDPVAWQSQSFALLFPINVL